MARSVRVFAIALAVACSSGTKRDGEWPPITRSDRACQTDADCTVRVHACCTACGPFLGVAVNQARATRDDDARTSVCARVTCAHVACSEPTCWEEGDAYCDQGQCALRVTKRGTCAEDTP